MVAGTIAALHVEAGVAITPQTVGALAFQAREQGAEVTDLRAWLATQPHAPGPPPPVEVPPPVPPPPPSRASDAIDLAHAVITRDSPDIRNWPIDATLTELVLGADGVAINFTRRNGAGAWPFVDGPESKKPGDRDGQIQYTLWVGCNIDGQWYVAGAILCISRGPDDNYVPTGPVLEVGQLPRNWYYFAGAPLATYQPQPGEMVAWFVTAGAQRRGDVHTIRVRSNVVVAPFRAGTFL
jgi:hypothetical protein